MGLWFALKRRLWLISVSFLWCLLLLCRVTHFFTHFTMISGSGGWGCVCVPSSQASLVLNIINKDGNSLFSVIPTLEIGALSAMQWKWGALNELYRPQWLHASTDNLLCVRLWPFGWRGCWLIDICGFCLECGVTDWNEDYIINDPLWKSVGTARSDV